MQFQAPTHNITNFHIWIQEDWPGFIHKKTHICFENTQRRSPTIHIWCRISNINWSSCLDHLHSQHSCWWSCWCSGNTWQTHLCQSLLPSLWYHQWHMCAHNLMWCHDLDLWSMTLTFKLSLDMLRLDLQTKFHVSMLVHSARIVRRTDTHTDRHIHTMSKLLHPPLTRGVKKK